MIEQLKIYVLKFYNFKKKISTSNKLQPMKVLKIVNTPLCTIEINLKFFNIKVIKVYLKCKQS